jgi:hypothetical protein
LDLAEGIGTGRGGFSVARAKQRRGQYTEDELIAYLQEQTRQLGVVPTMRTLQALQGPSPTTYLYYFGSWRQALLKAGLIDAQLVSERPQTTNAKDNTDHTFRMRYTNQDLVGFIQRYVQEHNGVVPTLTDFRDWALGNSELPTPMTISHRFGSWNRALQTAGYVASDHRARRMDDPDAVLQHLRELATFLGHEPTVIEYNAWARQRREEALAAFEAEYGPKPDTKDNTTPARAWRRSWRERLRRLPVGSRTYFRHFGSWTAATTDAMNPPERSEWTAEALLQAVDRLTHEFQHFPTSQEVHRYAVDHGDFPPYAAFRQTFGVWRDVKRIYDHWKSNGVLPDGFPATKLMRVPAEYVSLEQWQRALIDKIHVLYLHLGRIPIVKDFYIPQQDAAEGSESLRYEDILRAFGSWPKARRAWVMVYPVEFPSTKGKDEGGHNAG